MIQIETKRFSFASFSHFNTIKSSVGITHIIATHLGVFGYATWGVLGFGRVSAGELRIVRVAIMGVAIMGAHILRIIVQVALDQRVLGQSFRHR